MADVAREVSRDGWWLATLAVIWLVILCVGRK